MCVCVGSDSTELQVTVLPSIHDEGTVLMGRIGVDLLVSS